jgi:D-beta-D-heptose 7-phosphate kinase/D-beta-D-heptose 1-phosphate adenosyltransferase
MQPLDNFSTTKVLIVGDVMLDRYWWGSVGRISPEAPVPVVRLDRTTLSAGGAANVAVNIAGLGATPMLVGIVGVDSDAECVRRILGASGVDPDNLIGAKDRPTTVKTRVIAHSQQVVRVDQESDAYINPDAVDLIIGRVKSQIADADAMIISDYSKGMMTNRVLSTIIDLARDSQTPVLVDPKGKDYTKYKGVSLITPNRREAAEACNLNENTPSVVDVAGNRLLSELAFESLLITQGEEGMTLFRRDVKSRHFPTAARKVYDVTGAGDTVIATLATALGAGADLETATLIANVAAGSVVEQIGTTAITLQGLRAALDGWEAAG